MKFVVPELTPEERQEIKALERAFDAARIQLWDRLGVISAKWKALLIEQGFEYGSHLTLLDEDPGTHYRLRSISTWTETLEAPSEFFVDDIDVAEREVAP